MDFVVLEEAESFQQKVYKLQIQKEGDAFLKKIVSDYSWWTFDDCDIYKRETVSHTLMAQLTGSTLLLQADDEKREFVTKALPAPEATRENAESYTNAILDALALMRSRRDTSLDKLTPSALISLFSRKATEANVKTHLIEEFCGFLQGWERVFGSEICFVHGDLHTGNILQAKNGRFYPFDYEEAIESLPAFDGANISWTIHRQCGEEGYEYFKSHYHRRFGEPLIDLRDWVRFYRLRGWIASCYLEQCCNARMVELAKAFIERREPEPADAENQFAKWCLLLPSPHRRGAGGEVLHTQPNPQPLPCEGRGAILRLFKLILRTEPKLQSGKISRHGQARNSRRLFAVEPARADRNGV